MSILPEEEMTETETADGVIIRQQRDNSVEIEFPDGRKFTIYAHPDSVEITGGREVTIKPKDSHSMTVK